MKAIRDIPHPYVGAVRFANLEELRIKVSELEATARDMGVHPTEVFFPCEMVMTLRSDILTDKSTVLNATVEEVKS